MGCSHISNSDSISNSINIECVDLFTVETFQINGLHFLPTILMICHSLKIFLILLSHYCCLFMHFCILLSFNLMKNGKMFCMQEKMEKEFMEDTPTPDAGSMSSSSGAQGDGKTIKECKDMIQRRLRSILLNFSTCLLADLV